MKSKYKNLGAFALFCIAFNSIHAVDGYVAHEKTMFLRICDDSSYDPEASYDWKKENVDDDIFSISEKGACWVKIQGDNPGTAKIIALKDGTKCGSFEIMCVRLESLTVATKPTNERDRLKVGVGEWTTITVKPFLAGSPTWSKVSGNSELSSYTQSGSVTMYADDNNDTAKFKADFGDGFEIEIEYTVVKPDGVVLEKTSGNGTADSTGMSVEFEADVYIAPNDVNFVGISVGENQVTAQASGYFDYQDDVKVHPQNGPIAVSSFVDGKGSKTSVGDTVGGGTKDSNYSIGDFKYEIPWRYSLGDVEDAGFKTVDAVKTLREVSGDWTLKVEKLGQSQSQTE